MSDKYNGYMVGAGNIDKESWTIGREAFMEKRIKEFREMIGAANSGYVILSDNRIPYGYMAELTPASSWLPGCIAVDKDGNKLLAVGGDNCNGAERWEAI